LRSGRRDLRNARYAIVRRNVVRFDRSLLCCTTALLASLSLLSPARAEAPAPGTLVNAAILAGAVFSGASGAVLVNQAAGAGDEQANLAIVTIGIASDDALAGATTQKHSGTTASASGSARAFIGPHVFAGASGLVQLNQTAGDANATVNAFALHIAP
jgi:hypothetical protein